MNPPCDGRYIRATGHGPHDLTLERYVVTIRDDEPISTEDFKALLTRFGFRTQTEAGDALGIKQGYVSELATGKKLVLPATSLHKLIQALLREEQLRAELARSKK